MLSFPYLRKLKFLDLIRLAIVNLVCFGLRAHRLKKKRVIKSAVNIEEIIPMVSVTANPLIGPESTLRRTNAAIIVVMFESKIAEKAFLYPTWIADAIF